MTLSTIKNLTDGKKYNLRMAVCDKEVSSYTGGERTRLTFLDEDGATIEGVGFNDVLATCNLMEIGKTYVLNDVVCASYKEKMQLKILPTSTVCTSAVKVSIPTVRIADIANKDANEHVVLKVIVSSASADVSSTSSGGSVRKYSFMDPSGSIQAFAYNDASSDCVAEGTVVHVRAKIGMNKSLMLFSPMTATQDDALQTWWSTDGEQEAVVAKRRKPNYTPIAELTVDNIGKEVDVAGVILSCSLGISTTQSGVPKRTMQIADASGCAIDVTIFGEGDLVLTPYTSVYFTATVSEWNGVSLITRPSTFRNDVVATSHHKTLDDWWQDEGKTATMKFLSNQTLQFVTIEQARAGSETRVNIKGCLKDSVLTDDTGSIQVTAHASFNGSVKELNGNVNIRNALLTKDSLQIFKNSIRMQDDTPDISYTLHKPEIEKQVAEEAM